MRFFILFFLTGLGAFLLPLDFSHAKSSKKPSDAPAVQDEGAIMHIPLPKDLTDNQDPFNATHAQGAGDTEQYFHNQQNFREQNPTRNQESDRIIRQFE
ncbi:MAG: hypothetical protein EBT43_04965 [Methylocystaceae bacterium]|nr:hypothetical protein [Methylocystaceae bacterium]